MLAGDGQRWVPLERVKSKGSRGDAPWKWHDAKTGARLVLGDQAPTQEKAGTTQALQVGDAVKVGRAYWQVIAVIPGHRPLYVVEWRDWLHLM